MNRTLIIAIFYLLLIFSFSSTLEGFSTKGGGHNTITGEAAIQEKNEKSGNYHFMTWLDGTVDTPAALANFFTGAFDEDCTPINRTAMQELPLDGEWPIGPNGWGNFFEHFFN
ncbi:MAG: hypothetical protein AB7Y74_12270, partial [Syntrophorhabdus sp.]